MTNTHENDTATWLCNKLGSAEELWVPASISGIIKTTKIDNILRCFEFLPTIVKIKLLIGILHLPRRNLDEMKHTIGGIIEKALEDRDLWVTLVANMVKNYPTTVTLNLDLSGNQIAENVVEDISTKVNETNHFSTLPLECKLVNKLSFKSLVGQLPSLPTHFTLKKKPKSAALKNDLMKRANEASNQMKKTGTWAGIKTTIPVKHRDMTRKSSDVTPMKGLSNFRLINRSEGFRTHSTPSSASKRLNHRQMTGGTKLLDISEQPITGRDVSAKDARKRKKQAQNQESHDLHDADDENTKSRNNSTEASQNCLNPIEESEIVGSRDDFDEPARHSSVVEPSEIYSDEEMETNYNRATSGINSSKSDSQNTANGLTNIEANATDEATNTKKYQIILSFIFIT